MLLDKKVVDELEIGDKISEIIRKSRERTGVSAVDVARYLCEIWKTGASNANNYIRELEGNFFSRFGNKALPDRIGMHQKRIADYLASLGSTKNEINDIVRNIRKIRSDFEYKASDVKAYVK